MIKKLSKHGNSLALVIDRSILDLLKIDQETSLEVSTDGESLIVAPVRDKKRRQRFALALAASNERYGKALKRLAVVSRAFFDNPERKRNNHWYWLGLGVGAVAIATEDERLWLQARGIAEDAAHHIRADGALPMELERGPRALHYHAFSLMPLVVLAELAALRGEDFYAFHNGALGRLAALTLRGFDEPETFEFPASDTSRAD